MTMKSHLLAGSAIALFAAMALPQAAAAQSIGYGDVSGSGDSSSSGASDDGGSSGKGSRGSGRSRPVFTPYIEASQIVTAELSPGDEVLTYSQIAAGVEASIAGRNNAASVSLRYERRFGWGRAEDGDTISGVARGYTTITPGLQLEAGGLAARSRIEGNGSATLGPQGTGDAVTQVYSAYAGPAIATHAGDIEIKGSYLFGYTKVESPDAVSVTPGQDPLDVFDESKAHSANIHAGVKPGDALPVGIGAGAGYYREDISNLDQRIEDFHARGDLTLEVTRDVQLVGGLGYEDVEISGRDALLDGAGLPVVGPDGRLVTDPNSPRVLAYDVSGLIWDAGVIWRPSRRTALEAHVGRRYGSTTYYGTFAYAPNAKSSLNVSVYDNIAGFGGQLNRVLAGLPEEFTAIRDPLTGDIGGCVSSLEAGNCLSGALGSVRSATFRARGAMASYSVSLGRIQTGVGLGYDRRKFFAAPGTILAVANGVIDENYWMAAYFNGRIDENSLFTTNVYANWFQSGSAFTGDTTVIGATAAYRRNLTQRLAAIAAVGVEGVNREAPLEDAWTASALLGLRYSF